MGRLYQRLVEIPWRDRWLLVRVATWFAVHRLAMRVVGFKAWHECLCRLSPGRAMTTAKTPVLVARYTWGVQAVRRRLFPRATCLDESIVLTSLLKRQGIPAEMLLGVRRAGSVSDRRRNDLAAHAWVEVDGRVVNDDPVHAGSFTPLTQFASP